MFFIILLILTTISIAGIAAYFSIIGLAAIFTGVFWPVVVMGSALEVGKLTAASFLYRFWHKISFIMKAYLTAAILVLMLLTSMGIFGMLSQGYQQDVLPLKQIQQQITLYETDREEILTLKSERSDRKQQIDQDIANLPNNYVTGRQRLQKTYKPELDQIIIDLQKYTKQLRVISQKITDLKNEKLVKSVHVGPIIFIAKVFEQDEDNATKWLILLIIFAFDPLAVVLTIGTNMVILDRANNKQHHLLNQSSTVGNTPEPSSENDDEYRIIKLHDLLTELDNESELSPAQLQDKKILQEMLIKKEITRKVRTGTLDTPDS